MLAVILGIGMTTLYSFSDFVSGFWVGLVGLFFIRNSFRNYLGFVLFPIIAGLSFYLGIFVVAYQHNNGTIMPLGTIISLVIAIGTLINLPQFSLLKKFAGSGQIILSWFVYNGILATFSIGMVPSTDRSDHWVDVYMSLWQVGFYLMLVFYTHKLMRVKTEIKNESKLMGTGTFN